MRINGTCLLDETVEELSPMGRKPTVESEGEFLQVVGQMLPRDPSLVNTQEPPLEQGGNAVHMRQEGRALGIFSSARSRLMNIAEILHMGVGKPAVSYDRGGWCDHLPNESGQVVVGSARDDLKAQTAHPFVADFDGGSYYGLRTERHSETGTLATPFASAADIDFIDLDLSAKLLSIRPDHRPAQLMEAHPGSSIAPKLQGPLEAQGAQSSLLVGEPPDRPKPEPEGQMAAVKDRTCGLRNHHATLAALPGSPRQEPALPVTTSRAQEAVGPANLDQISPAGFFSSKLPFKFHQIPGKEPCHADSLF